MDIIRFMGLVSPAATQQKRMLSLHLGTYQEDVWGNGGKRVQPRTNSTTHTGDRYTGIDVVTQNQ